MLMKLGGSRQRLELAREWRVLHPGPDHGGEEVGLLHPPVVPDAGGDDAGNRVPPGSPADQCTAYTR